MMKIFAVALAIVAVAAAEEMQAVVKMMPNDATNVTGYIKLVQSGPTAPVVITGELIRLKPGTHGFHVHEKGDLSAGCNSTGSHFNPLKKRHGAPGDTERHVGDLGNVEANSQGVATLNIRDSIISLTGPYSIIGRAFVVHADPDDLGKGNHTLSSTTGNAGARLACGVVGVVSPMGSWPSSSVQSSINGPFVLLMSIATLLVAHQSRSV